jgi:hypothetical protein
VIAYGWLNEVIDNVVIPTHPQSNKNDLGCHGTSEICMEKRLSPSVTTAPTNTSSLNKVSEQSSSKIEIVRAWLFSIGEPEADHQLVLNRCKADAQALEYFMKLAKENDSLS